MHVLCLPLFTPPSGLHPLCWHSERITSKCCGFGLSSVEKLCIPFMALPPQADTGRQASHTGKALRDWPTRQGALRYDVADVDEMPRQAAHHFVGRLQHYAIPHAGMWSMVPYGTAWHVHVCEAFDGLKSEYFRRELTTKLASTVLHSLSSAVSPTTLFLRTKVRLLQMAAACLRRGGHQTASFCKEVNCPSITGIKPCRSGCTSR